MDTLALETIKYSLRFRMFDNALLLCQEFFNRFPSSDLLLLYARIYMESGLPKQASILLTQYQQYFEENPKIVLLYAQSFFESGEYLSSESTLKKMDLLLQKSDLKKNDREFLLIACNFLRGQINIRTHRHNIAKDNFTKCVSQNRYMLAAFKSMNNSTPIKEAPRRFFKINLPQTPPTVYEFLASNSGVDLDTGAGIPEDYQNLITTLKAKGIYYFQRSQYLQAASVFRRLYELHPYCIDGVDTYSTVLWQLKDVSTLNELARSSIELAPNRPEPWIAHGNLLSLQLNSKDAIVMFERAAHISRECSYALALAGHEYLLLQQLNDSAVSFRTSLGRNPYEWTAWYGLGEVQFRQDNFATAEYYIRKAIDINPHSSILFYTYSTVLRKCDRDNEAMEMVQKSLELDPTNVVALYHMGQLCYDRGDLQGAQEVLEKTSSFVAKEPQIAFLRGKIAQQLNDFKKSLSCFVEASIYGIEKNPDFANSIEGMINCMLDKIINNEKSENE